MTQNDLNPPTQELSVGQTLRQEREKRQLSLEQAAQQLKLRVEILRNLELDQPDKAILPTFMRGYLKSYARFLKLPEQA
ncbi:MAG: helix-turn-helix domain-containing protein, partial [Alishewanella aestuarii]